MKTLNILIVDDDESLTFRDLDARIGSYSEIRIRVLFIFFAIVFYAF
jgi:hypothetical protein